MTDELRLFQRAETDNTGVMVWYCDKPVHVTWTAEQSAGLLKQQQKTRSEQASSIDITASITSRGSLYVHANGESEIFLNSDGNALFEARTWAIEQQLSSTHTMPLEQWLTQVMELLPDAVLVGMDPATLSVDGDCYEVDWRTTTPEQVVAAVSVGDGYNVADVAGDSADE